MDFLTQRLALNSNLCLMRCSKDAVIRYDKICRTCLSANNVVSLLNVTYENVNFADLLEQHVSIQVREQDLLPTQICDGCRTELINLHKFKTKCLQTQVTLEEIIKYHEAHNTGIGIQSCNSVQVPFIFQEVVTCQENNGNKDEVQEINSNKVVKNNNQNIWKEQINSDKIISINDGANLQMEVIIGDNQSSLILEDTNDRKEQQQETVLKGDSDNIAKTEHKIIMTGVDVSETINTKEQETANEQKVEVQKEQKKLASKWTCKICKEKFDSKDEIQQHREDTKHHQRARRSTCHICGKLISSPRMSIHLRTHSLEKPYKCHICHKAFNSKTNMQRHIKIHTGERQFICEICGKGFIQAWSLHMHRRTHSNNKQRATDGDGAKAVPNFTCDHCGRGFRRLGRYTVHVKQHINNSNDSNKESHDEEIKEYSCDICKRAYKTKQLLKAHQLLHGEKKFLCSVCGKGFVTKAGLLSHLKVHTGERPYTCTICKKTFGYMASFESHMFIHKGLRPYNCNVCTKAFTQVSHLKYHLRTHSGERPYVCTYCGKAFALKGYFNIHVRIHTGETPYLCPVCGRGFYDSGSMKKHRKSHGNVLTEPTEPNVD